MYFTNEEVEHLNREHGQARRRVADLIERCVVRQYKDAHAQEYATQGVARRLGTLGRCIDRVFEILPPEYGGIPERDVVIDATINIQAFVLNIFGCCDNLAWVWVYEKAVTQDNGLPLEPKMVGLGESFRRVRKSFPPAFSAYLDSRKQWFKHIKEFRDSLAHRVPLYIPPHFVAPEHRDKYLRLEAAATEALISRNLTQYERLIAEREALSFFRPWMTHSFFENSPVVSFHSQLLSDFNTIDEMALNLLHEL